MPALFTNQDAAIVELRTKLAQVTAERDRARDTAVALEQEVAEVGQRGRSEAWEKGYRAGGSDRITSTVRPNPYRITRGGAA